MNQMKEWYYASGKLQIGPVSEDVIKQKIVAGEIKAKTLLWNSDLSNWTPAIETCLGDAFSRLVSATDRRNPAKASSIENSQERWYFVSAGQQFGPISEETIRQKIKQGDINKESLVWNEDLANWTPAIDTCFKDNFDQRGVPNVPKPQTDLQKAPTQSIKVTEGGVQSLTGNDVALAKAVQDIYTRWKKQGNAKIWGIIVCVILLALPQSATLFWIGIVVLIIVSVIVSRKIKEKTGTEINSLKQRYELDNQLLFDFITERVFLLSGSFKKDREELSFLRLIDNERGKVLVEMGMENDRQERQMGKEVSRESGSPSSGDIVKAGVATGVAYLVAKRAAENIARSAAEAAAQVQRKEDRKSEERMKKILREHSKR